MGILRIIVLCLFLSGCAHYPIPPEDIMIWLKDNSLLYLQKHIIREETNGKIWMPAEDWYKVQERLKRKPDCPPGEICG